MALKQTPICDFGWKAPDFALPDLGGEEVALRDVAGPNGALIMFICNHCPYVRAIIDRLVDDVNELQAHGVGVAAIMSNDFKAYPADAPEHMRAFANTHAFTFPYLLDETQSVARDYGAVCTPDFYGFDADLGLQYRGRLDAGRLDPPPSGAPRELLDAMKAVAKTGQGPRDQQPSMGCSLKWRV